MRHRAVARRAGLPLASTTYYFSSLDDLIANAVEYVGAREAEQLRQRVAVLSRRRRGAESTAEVLVDLLVGDAPETRVSEQLISRYERYIACARQPGLRDIQRRILRQRTDAVVEVVERSGRAVRAELLTALVCAVDGAVVAALVGDGDGPRATARATLIDVIDVLAPIDEQSRGCDRKGSHESARNRRGAARTAASNGPRPAAVVHRRRHPGHRRVCVDR